MLEFGNALKNFDPAAVTTYRIDSTSHTTSDGATGRDPRRSRATTCRRSSPSSAARRPSPAPLSRSSTSRPPRSPGERPSTSRRRPPTPATTTGEDTDEAPDHHAARGRRRGERGRGRPRPVRHLRLTSCRPERHLTAPPGIVSPLVQWVRSHASRGAIPRPVDPAMAPGPQAGDTVNASILLAEGGWQDVRARFRRVDGPDPLGSVRIARHRRRLLPRPSR